MSKRALDNVDEVNYFKEDYFTCANEYMRDVEAHRGLDHRFTRTTPSSPLVGFFDDSARQLRTGQPVVIRHLNKPCRTTVTIPVAYSVKLSKAVAQIYATKLPPKKNAHLGSRWGALFSKWTRLSLSLIEVNGITLMTRS